MQGVEFEEERDIMKSPNHVTIVKPSPMVKHIARHRFSKSEAQTAVLLLVLAVLMFASSGAIFYRIYESRQLGLVISPSSLSDFERYQLPENIRMYIH